MVLGGQPTPCFFFITDYAKNNFLPCRSSTITRSCEARPMGSVGADVFRNFWLHLTLGRNRMVLAGHPRPCETRICGKGFATCMALRPLATWLSYLKTRLMYQSLCRFKMASDYPYFVYHNFVESFRAMKSLPVGHLHLSQNAHRYLHLEPKKKRHDVSAVDTSFAFI